MDLTKKYRLINDVISHLKPGYIYGKAGTEIIILHDHNDMMIVQDGAGNKFHSRTDNIIAAEEYVPAAVKIDQPVIQKSESKRKAKGKAVLVYQSNLF